MKIDRQEIYRLAGFIGVAMALAGLFRYLIQGVWTGEGVMGKLTPVMAIIGLVLIAVSVVFNFGAIVGVFKNRQGKLGANTIILLVAVLALVVVANFLGYRHHKRFDLTTEGLYSISEQTKKVAANLSKDVKVIYFNKDETQFSDLMREYKYAGSRISYERVDPQKSPGLVRQYKPKREGDIAVVAGDRTEIISSGTEQAVTNAILKVTRDTVKTVCFVEGHGEKPLSDTQGPTGYGTAEQRLKDENFQVKTVLLAREQQVPSECAALVVAGPKNSITPPETAMIGKYLDGGGKAMLLLDPETKPELDDVLKSWGIEAADNIAIDATGRGQLVGAGPTAPLVFDYGSHSITKDFTRTLTVFPEARSLKITNGAGANVSPLLKTSEASFAKDKIPTGPEIPFDEAKDQKGPLTLGAAGSKNASGKESRLVVIGDSDFATNGAFKFQSNGDLFLNSINWLAEEEDLISIRPKSMTNRSVTMSESQLYTFLLFTVALMPLAVLGSGAYIWWKRR
jgi:gliding motility-associatede transport system auxiliary component